GRRSTLAVAGIRIPLRDFRSPASFDGWTSSRSAVMRMDCLTSDRAAASRSAIRERGYRGSRLQSLMNRTLRRLAVVTTVFTYLLVAVGGLVRGTGSGLGCPDWPRCHGRFLPPLEYHAIIEYSHRATASVVIWLTVALAVVAVRNHRALSPRVFTLAVIPLPIVLSQAILGAIVVHLDLQAESVVAHLLVAMRLVAVVISLMVEVAPAGSPLAAPTPRAGAADTSAIDRRFAALATGVAGSTLFLLLLGSYVGR